MNALSLLVALLAQVPAVAEPPTRSIKVRILVGEKPAPPETEVRLFPPSDPDSIRLCGTAQYRMAAMQHPDKDGWVTFEKVLKGSGIRAEHPAFGTVGLSMSEGGRPISLVGLFTPVGKIMMMVMMFVGRVGPLTLALALAHRASLTPKIRYPEGKVLIG